MQPKSPPRGKPGASKITKFFGGEVPSHIIEKLNADSKPWYLRPNYDQSEIMMEPDGTVRAGTPAALVERLTAHEQGGKRVATNCLRIGLTCSCRHHLQPEFLTDVQVIYDRRRALRSPCEAILHSGASQLVARRVRGMDQAQAEHHSFTVGDLYCGHSVRR